MTNWIVVGEQVEAATATDDLRPAFRQMMERACDNDKPFDVIVRYGFNRFCRNGADMELAIIKLRKLDVEVVITCLLKLYCDFNNVGVHSFILTGAPLIHPRINIGSSAFDMISAHLGPQALARYPQQLGRF